MARAPGRASHSLGNLRAVLGQALKIPGVREPRRSTGPGVDQSCHWDASGGGDEVEQRAHGTMSGASLSRGTDLCLGSQEMVKSPCCGLNCFFVQSLSCAQLFLTPWTVACQASLSFTFSWSLLKLKSIELVMPSNHLILCHPLLLLPSVFPCIRVFANESALPIRGPKYWSFSLSISPSNEYSGLIFFMID